MIKPHAMRLRPGDDLKKSIDAYVEENKLDAAFILTCVGSLSVATLRMANEELNSEIKGPFEIVSLVGTASLDGGSHLHIALSDHKGNCIGGHLMEGARIYTTAEILIGEPSNMIFTRELCSLSGYKELVINQGDKFRL